MIWELNRMHLLKFSMYKIKKMINLVKRPGLTRSLVAWFLILGLLPLSIVSWFSYQQSQSSLYMSAIQVMSQRTALQSHFIKNWFHYRFLDLKHQAESRVNIDFLNKLVKARKSSDKNVMKFVGSREWFHIVNKYKYTLENMSNTYGHFYDVFLIDKKGNILFTLSRESDLGTNLINGPLKNSRFATTVRQTMVSGEYLFSDLEFYAPSNNTVSGFMVAPLQNKHGKIIGAFAFQIDIQKINEVIADRAGVSESKVSYLVGEDMLLRSTISNQPSAQVLQTRINTAQTQEWKNKHGNEIVHDENDDEVAFSYSGPFGRQVLGIHHDIGIANVHWGLITEIDKDQALAPAYSLAKLMLSQLIILLLIVILLAIILANRLVQPLLKLVDASRQVTAGRLQQNVVVHEKNEIGELAKAFNLMLKTRHEYESELEANAKKNQQILNDLAEQKFALDQHAIVATTDIMGKITFANDKFCEISGYSHAELIGQNHRLLNSGYHTRDFFRQMYQTISNGKVWHNEICNKTKDGAIYWVDTTIVPFMGASGKPKSYIAIRTDISSQKQIETKLISAMDAAQDAVRQKSEFLANMSHEIRTPMNGVIGTTSLLLETALTPQQRSYAEISMQSAEALLAIINDILDFSKIEAGKLDLEQVPFDLQILAEDAAELLLPKCRDKNLELLFHFMPGTPRNVIGDPGRIRQIMLNLLSNAIKFTDQGYILLTIGKGDEMSGTPMVMISVKDSGVGIHPDKLDIIFNKFDQADGSTSRKYGGTGLGLSITKHLCEMMGGSVTAESEYGHGTKFSATILLRENNLKPVEDKQTEFMFDGLKTLIVDDLEMARLIIKEQIIDLGMEIDMAASGKEALDMMRAASREENPFDLVIIDHRMPEMDGESLAMEISRDVLLKQTVLVFVTSTPYQGDSARLKQVGFSAYLTKPTRTSEIPKILSVVFSARQKAEVIPLVTRYTVQEEKIFDRKKIEFEDVRILLAEDNPVNQMIATEMLTDYACHITPANNGLEVLQLVKEHSFDLIFMDCQMPEMDGFEATRMMREYESQNDKIRTPVIAFTANAMQGDREKCISAGMDDYISKPVNNASLERVLLDWLPHKLSRRGNNCEKTPDVYMSDIHEAAEQVEDADVTDENNFMLVWDKNETMSRLGGKQSSLKLLLKLFNDDTPQRVEKLHHAINNKQYVDVVAHAHSIKGVTGNLSAKHVQKFAEMLETAGKNADSDRLDSLWEEFYGHYQKLSDCLQYEIKMLSTVQVAENSAISDSDIFSLDDTLQTLISAVQHGDYVDPETVLVLQEKFPQRHQLTFQQLYEQICKLDYETVLKTLQQLTIERQQTAVSKR